MVFNLANGFKSLISTSALIVRTEADGTNRQRGLAGSSDSDSGSGSSILDLTTRSEGESELTVTKTANYSIMDLTKPSSSMIKEADYVVDVILPTILIALLFIGNAFIVYVIFQYRKRKVPVNGQEENIALSGASRSNPQV